MPRAPTYGGPQLRTAPLQPAYQSNIDVSSGVQSVARGIGQMGEAVDRIQMRDAELQANKVDTDVTAGWLEWDAQARKKYQGQNVDQYEAEAKAWWDKARDTYAKDLSPMAGQQVALALSRKRNQAIGAVLGHVNAEKERAADSQADAAALTTIEMAVDTGDVAGGAARVRQISAQKGARKGWSTEEVQADQQRLLGTMHLAYISKVAEADAEKAKAYFEANKTEIPATAQVKIEAVLKGEADNQFAVQFAAKQADKPLAEQLAEAGKITDPQRREKTLLQVRNNNAMVEAAKRQAEASAADEAWQMVGQGRRVPEAVLQRMDGKSRVQLQEHLADRARQASERGAMKTDWVTYIETRDKLAAGEKVDLRPLTTKIAGPQMEQLLDIQTRMNNPKQRVEVATSEQQTAAFAQQMGLSNEKLGQFKSAANDLFNEHLKAKGKEPTYDERQAILDNLTKEIVTSPGRFWDTTGPAYTAPRDVRNKALAPDKFTAGAVYVDGAGNRAKYLGGGKWEPIK